MTDSAKETITSTKNPKVQHVCRLHRTDVRRDENLFVVEGIREIRKAISAGYEFKSVFVCRELARPEETDSLLKYLASAEILDVGRRVYARMAYREDSGGMLALAVTRQHSLNMLECGRNPLVLVAEGIEKPGNLGGMLRTADAAGVDALIVCDPRTDVYNPNVIRASLGCVFTVPLAVTDSGTAIKWLRSNGITIYCASLHASVPHYNVDFSGPFAIVMGSEATGLSESWLHAADSSVIIAMKGEADSLNVAASAAVILFEARRQRDGLRM